MLAFIFAAKYDVSHSAALESNCTSVYWSGYSGSYDTYDPCISGSWNPPAATVSPQSHIL